MEFSPPTTKTSTPLSGTPNATGSPVKVRGRIGRQGSQSAEFDRLSTERNSAPSVPRAKTFTRLLTGLTTATGAPFISTPPTWSHSPQARPPHAAPRSRCCTELSRPRANTWILPSSLTTTEIGPRTSPPKNSQELNLPPLSSSHLWPTRPVSSNAKTSMLPLGFVTATGAKVGSSTPGVPEELVPHFTETVRSITMTVPATVRRTRLEDIHRWLRAPMSRSIARSGAGQTSDLKLSTTYTKPSQRHQSGALARRRHEPDFVAGDGATPTTRQPGHFVLAYLCHRASRATRGAKTERLDRKTRNQATSPG